MSSRAVTLWGGTGRIADADLQRWGGRLPLATSIIGRGRISRVRKQAERGFSLLEVVISMALLTVGLVSLLGVFGLAMASTQTSQQDMIAKQLAMRRWRQYRDRAQYVAVSWAQVQNIANGGIFLNGANPIYLAGADGIVGTADDAVAGEQTLTEPGPDGILEPRMMYLSL